MRLILCETHRPADHHQQKSGKSVKSKTQTLLAHLELEVSTRELARSDHVGVAHQALGNFQYPGVSIFSLPDPRWLNDCGSLIAVTRNDNFRVRRSTHTVVGPGNTCPDRELVAPCSFGDY